MQPGAQMGSLAVEEQPYLRIVTLVIEDCIELVEGLLEAPCIPQCFWPHIAIPASSNQVVRWAGILSQGQWRSVVAP